MTTKTQQEADCMTEQEQKEYCMWCFNKDYGHCERCSLYKHTVPKDKVNSVHFSNVIGSAFDEEIEKVRSSVENRWNSEEIINILTRLKQSAISHQ